MENSEKNPVLGLLESDWTLLNHQSNLKKLENFLLNGEDYEAILMCSILYQEDEESNQKVSNALRQILGLEHDYGKKDERFFENRLFHIHKEENKLKRWHRLYNETIVSFVRFSYKTDLNRLLIASTFAMAPKESSEYEKQILIITKMFEDFFKDSSRKHCMNVLIQTFQKLPKRPFEETLPIAFGLQAFLGKFIDMGHERMCVALFAFYLYLGKTYISDLILGVLNQKNCDFETLYHELIELEEWPWYSKENFDDKCKRLDDNRQEKDGRNPLRDFLNRDASIWTLVPLILHAQKKGNVEATSRILWHISRRENFPKLIERFQELNGGYDIDQKYYNIPPDKKGEWLNKKMSDFHKMLHYSSRYNFSNRHIEDLKLVYAIRPFDSLVLSAMFRVSTAMENVDLLVIYRNSIDRIKSHTTLGSLLISAIRSGNEDATRAVALRICKLGFYNTLLFGVEGILSDLNKSSFNMRNRSLSLAGLVLELFGQFASLENKRYLLALAEYKEWQRKFPTPKFAAIQPQKFTREETLVLKLFANKRYSSVVQMLSPKETSLTILETTLQSALKTNNSYAIVQVYSLLAKSNKVIAATYNTEVEFHFCVLQMKLREFKTKDRLVSSVWDYPAMLENPVNFQTRIIAENLFDITHKEWEE